MKTIQGLIDRTRRNMRDKNWPAPRFSQEEREEMAIREAVIAAMEGQREEDAQFIDGLTVTARDMNWSGHYCAEVLAIKLRKREVLRD